MMLTPLGQEAQAYADELEVLKSRDTAMLSYQIDWINDESDVAIWEKSRRVGADFAEAFRCVRERISGERVVDYWYSSADETAALEQAVYVRLFLEMYNIVYREIAETDLIDGKDMKVMTFVLPEVGGRCPRITLMTSNPKRFRSKGGDVTLSELAFHQNAEEMWKAAAMSTMWGGRLRVISSHNGEESFFNQLVGQARKHADPEQFGQPRSTDVKASLHTTDIFKAVEAGLVKKINAANGTNYTNDEFIDMLRSKCSSDEVFDEELGCKPSKQSGSYFPFSLTRQCVFDNAAMPTDSLAQFLEDIASRASGYDTLYAGSDVARKNDRFVITVLGKSGIRRDVIGMLVLHNQKFSVMKAAIDAVMSNRFGGKQVRRISIDETGLGMQLAEETCDKLHSRAEGVTMTLAVKADMFGRLRISCEDRTIGLPDSVEVFSDFAAVRREVTAAGNIRYLAPKTGDGHSDRATATALAIVAAESAKSPMRQVKMTGGVV